MSDDRMTPAAGGTWEHAWELARANLLAMLLLGSAAGFTGRAILSGKRRRIKDIEPDIDVDVLDPELIKRLLAGERIEPEEEEEALPKAASIKEAQLSWRDVVALTAAFGGGGAGGYLLGHGLGDVLANRDIDRELAEAREEFNAAMLEEQIAAAATGERSPFAPYLGKPASMSKTAEEPFNWKRLLGAGIAGLTVPTGVISYLILRNYFEQQDVQYAKYEKALAALKSRMAAEQPYAQLSSEITPEMLEALKRHGVVPPGALKNAAENKTLKEEEKDEDEKDEDEEKKRKRKRQQSFSERHVKALRVSLPMGARVLLGGLLGGGAGAGISALLGKPPQGGFGIGALAGAPLLGGYFNYRATTASQRKRKKTMAQRSQQKKEE